MAKPKMTLVAILAALFPKSEKVISEKLEQGEFDAFSAEAQEVQNRLDAQQEGNEAVATDLATANADREQLRAELTTANNKLEAANTDIQALRGQLSGLQPKADAWDKHKAALDGANVTGDSTNGSKANGGSELSQKEQAHLDRKGELKAKYPGLMADIDAPTQE